MIYYLVYMVYIFRGYAFGVIVINNNTRYHIHKLLFVTMARYFTFQPFLILKDIEKISSETMDFGE